MNILAHRGYWLSADEKNSVVAFRRAFAAGFGVETDLRDYRGEIVISHDYASSSSLPIDDFLSLYREAKCEGWLALNIKADGMQADLGDKLRQHEIDNYFVFDMAVPDALGYCKAGLRAFTRQSEFETVPAFVERAAGVWMDEFERHWITKDAVSAHLTHGRDVAIVSPELHGRSHRAEWADYRAALRGLAVPARLFICTDFPLEAAEFFHDH
jgi:glycerophosphoryl diester phosphodiesterase